MQDVQILSDLAERWRCARRAALKAVVPLDGTDPPDGTEDSWLRRALAQDVEATHRQVFENSLRLGLGFARYYDHELALDVGPRVSLHCTDLGHRAHDRFISAFGANEVESINR